eukprot:IDg14637t1
MDEAHAWHIRLNHTAPDTIRIMAGIPEAHPKSASQEHHRAPKCWTHTSGRHCRTALGITGWIPLCVTSDGAPYAIPIGVGAEKKSEAEAALLTIITAVARHFGKAPAQLRVENANELMTKATLLFIRQRGIAIDPTVPTLRKRIVWRNVGFPRCSVGYERRWRRLKCLGSGTGVGVQSTRLSNIIRHGREQLMRSRARYGRRTAQTSEAGTRAVLVRYLYVDGANHYRMMRPETGQVIRCRVENYLPYNPTLDPKRLLMPIGAPTEGHKARPGTPFSYKTDFHGRITGHKVRLSFPGNCLCPGVHYDPPQLAVYKADHAAVRLVLALGVHLNLLLFHVDITAACLHEPYLGGVAAVCPGSAHVRRFAAPVQGGRVYVAVTVDDFCIATPSHKAYRTVLADLCRKYQAKDLGPVRRLLG